MTAKAEALVLIKPGLFREYSKVDFPKQLKKRRPSKNDLTDSFVMYRVFSNKIEEPWCDSNRQIKKVDDAIQS
ncbi:MAG: hypothetical protein RBT80_23935 [Candidatus Vecturithrix sp.]|nr:hypothetical protein [Candidatus Vecturithrix sp.]